MVVDLDYFKQVNDSMGHDAGDHLLKEFSQRLQDGLGQADFAVRIGGDEFAILLGSLKNEEEAKRLVENIIEMTTQPVIYQDQNIEPSATIGHAIGMTIIAEGIETADQAAELRKLGCERGQGYYYSMPLTPNVIDLEQLQLRFAA